MRMSSVLYMPQAKWKAGERRAFRTAATWGDRCVPAFKIPPAGSFDPDEQRVLSPAEHLSRFGHQLADSRGKRLAFIDAELVDDVRHREAVKVHPLTELLERAWLEGGNAAPIFSGSSSPDYLEAVRRFVSRATLPVTCLRVGLHELESIGSPSNLEAYAAAAGASPEATVLLIDGGPLQIDDPEDLAHLLAGQMARLVVPGTWLRVFWSATSIPNRPKIDAGNVARFPRSDWALYEAILRNKDEFPVVPMFSDYMLEYPGDYNPIRVSPTAQLRYSTASEYIFSKGRSTKYEDKYANIFPVAARLMATGEVREESYSTGDAYIRYLADAKGKTGNASLWRWCSTDHHLSFVDEQLTKAFGIRRESLVPAVAAEQLLLV